MSQTRHDEIHENFLSQLQEATERFPYGIMCIIKEFYTSESNFRKKISDWILPTLKKISELDSLSQNEKTEINKYISLYEQILNAPCSLPELFQKKERLTSSDLTQSFTIVTQLIDSKYVEQMINLCSEFTRQSVLIDIFFITLAKKYDSIPGIILSDNSEELDASRAAAELKRYLAEAFQRTMRYESLFKEMEKNIKKNIDVLKTTMQKHLDEKQRLLKLEETKLHALESSNPVAEENVTPEQAEQIKQENIRKQKENIRELTSNFDQKQSSMHALLELLSPRHKAVASYHKNLAKRIHAINQQTPDFESSFITVYEDRIICVLVSLEKTKLQLENALKEQPSDTAALDLKWRYISQLINLINTGLKQNKHILDIISDINQFRDQDKVNPLRQVSDIENDIDNFCLQIKKEMFETILIDIKKDSNLENTHDQNLCAEFHAFTELLHSLETEKIKLYKEVYNLDEQSDRKTQTKLRLKALKEIDIVIHELFKKLCAAHQRMRKKIAELIKPDFDNSEESEKCPAAIKQLKNESLQEKGQILNDAKTKINQIKEHYQRPLERRRPGTVKITNPSLWQTLEKTVSPRQENRSSSTSNQRPLSTKKSATPIHQTLFQNSIPSSHSSSPQNTSSQEKSTLVILQEIIDILQKIIQILQEMQNKLNLSPLTSLRQAA